MLAGRTAEAQEYLPRKVLTSRSAQLRKNLVTIIWIAITGIILLIAGTTKPVGLYFVDSFTARVPSILGGLFLVSVFVERLVEVFVSIWRDPESDLLDQELINWRVLQVKRKREISDLLYELQADSSAQTSSRKSVIETELPAKRRELSHAEEKEASIEERLVPYHSRTREVSTWVAVASGVLIAAIGFRFFHQILDVTRLSGYAQHEGWFVFLDVMLTGLILAGGSKTMHYLFSVFDSLMRTARLRSERIR
ncbi:MAG: hypothetical protein M3R59_09375 [Verrucomicrobiota bacterium]|nr:hypothetical protein [Verrucomicrobiota bacterium]